LSFLFCTHRFQEAVARRNHFGHQKIKGLIRFARRDQLGTGVRLRQIVLHQGWKRGKCLFAHLCEHGFAKVIHVVFDEFAARNGIGQGFVSVGGSARQHGMTQLRSAQTGVELDLGDACQLRQPALLRLFSVHFHRFHVGPHQAGQAKHGQNQGDAGAQQALCQPQFFQRFHIQPPIFNNPSKTKTPSAHPGPPMAAWVFRTL
jgi:hypothetical protein